MKQILGLIGVFGAIALQASVASAAPDVWTDLSLDANPLDREHPASCEIGGIIYVAGGYNSNGVAVTDLYAFDESAIGGAAYVQLTSMPANTEAGEMEAIAISATECLFVGGRRSKTGDTIAQALIYDTVNDVWSADDSLTTARVDFKLRQCGNSRVIAVGGKTVASGVTTFPSNVEVLSPNAASTWANIATLNVPRSFLGVDTANSQDFVLSGGEVAAGPSNKIELLDTDAACTTMAVRNCATTLGTARLGAELIDEGTANTFLAVGGETATTLLRTTEKITVPALAFGDATCNPTGTVNDLTVAAGPNAPYAMSKYEVATDGSVFMLAGGFNFASAITSSVIYDPSQTRFETVANDANQADDLFDGASAGVLEFAGSKFYYLQGRKGLNGPFLANPQESP